MQTPESNGFLDLIATMDPKLLIAAAVIIVVWLVVRIRSGAIFDPMDAWRGEDDDGLGHYTVEDFRRDYNPDDKWNTPPANHDRL